MPANSGDWAWRTKLQRPTFKVGRRGIGLAVEAVADVLDGTLLEQAAAAALGEPTLAGELMSEGGRQDLEHSEKKGSAVKAMW